MKLVDYPIKDNILYVSAGYTEKRVMAISYVYHITNMLQSNAISVKREQSQKKNRLGVGELWLILRNWRNSRSEENTKISSVLLPPRNIWKQHKTLCKHSSPARSKTVHAWLNNSQHRRTRQWRPFAIWLARPPSQCRRSRWPGCRSLGTKKSDSKRWKLSCKYLGKFHGYAGGGGTFGGKVTMIIAAHNVEQSWQESCLSLTLK